MSTLTHYKEENKLPLASHVKEALDEQILYRKSAQYKKGTAFIGNLY